MIPDRPAVPVLDDIKVHVRFKLSALWASVTFCYIYGDYFQLWQPGQLEAMIAGKMAFFHITQGVLLWLAAAMAIPSLMVFFVTRLASKGKSLGKHRFGLSVHRDDDSGDKEWMALLRFFWPNRNHTDVIDCLVRMVLVCEQD